MKELPSLTIQSDSDVGLYLHCDEAAADAIRKCLTADELKFSINPPEAAHLAQLEKAVIVFTHKHPLKLARRLKRCGIKVAIHSDIVLPETHYHPPVDRLLSLGAPSQDMTEEDAARDFSKEDVAALIRMATDGELHDAPEGSPSAWAPIHAWRALARLKANESIAPLVQVFRRVDDEMDEWISEDLPQALAHFGEDVISPAAEFLANTSHGEWSRLAAAMTFGHLAKVHPELRAECIARLSAQLEHFEEQSDSFNANLMVPLWDLRALEAMPVIERAFASGRVDESVQGDLEDIQIEFGLKSQREHPAKPNKLTKLGEAVRSTWQAAGLPLPDANANFPLFDDESEGDLIELEPKTEAVSQPYKAPPKIGRNDPCPCGSGKKYKKCCAT